MAKITALEWFWVQLDDSISKKYYDLFQQCKAIEKNQIQQAFIDGDCGYSPDNGNVERMAIDYYTETYSNGKKK
jgi:hypothetical protein